MDLLRNKIPLFFLLLLITNMGYTQSFTEKALQEMLISVNSVQTLRYKLKKTERVKGVNIVGEQIVKYANKPRQVYTYILSPNKGVEVLWREGKNNNHAYVNPNAFPYMNLHLDPYGSIMRNNNHHTVYEVGFDYIGEIVSHIAKQHKSDFNSIFKYEGEVKFDNKLCYKITINFTSFKYFNYLVKEGETINSIAKDLFVSDFMIRELNPKYGDSKEVKKGHLIIVPNAYAKKTILYINKENKLPVFQCMIDEKGIFGQYEFFDVIVNAPISKEEFTPEYKDYGF